MRSVGLEFTENSPKIFQNFVAFLEKVFVCFSQKWARELSENFSTGSRRKNSKGHTSNFA